MKKKIILITLISFIILVVSSTGLAIRNYNSDYEITYKTDDKGIVFYLRYGSNYFGNVNANIDNGTVMIKELENSQDNTNILSKVGIVKKKKAISFKKKGNGITKIRLSLMGKYTDDAYFQDYQINASDEKISVVELNERR